MLQARVAKFGGGVIPGLVSEKIQGSQILFLIDLNRPGRFQGIESQSKPTLQAGIKHGALV